MHRLNAKERFHPIQHDVLEKGILQSRQEALLRLLRAKFGPLPSAVVEQIEALGDVNHLDALLEKILTARSLEEMGIF